MPGFWDQKTIPTTVDRPHGPQDGDVLALGRLGDHMAYVRIMCGVYDLGGSPTRKIMECSSVGMMTFPTEWEKKMFQTINQVYMFIPIT